MRTGEIEREELGPPDNGGEKIEKFLDGLLGESGKESPQVVRLRRNPRRPRLQTIPDWSPEEKAYLRRSFQYWKEGERGEDPKIPDGISNARAQILKYKAKGISEDSKRKRKMEELTTVSFKISREFFEQLALDAAEVDVNVSIFIRTCILLASPQIKSNPKIINFFSDSVIPK